MPEFDVEYLCLQIRIFPREARTTLQKSPGALLAIEFVSEQRNKSGGAHARTDAQLAEAVSPRTCSTLLDARATRHGGLPDTCWHVGACGSVPTFSIYVWGGTAMLTWLSDSPSSWKCCFRDSIVMCSVPMPSSRTLFVPSPTM